MKKMERVVWIACFLLYIAAMGALVYPTLTQAKAQEPPPQQVR